MGASSSGVEPALRPFCLLNVSAATQIGPTSNTQTPSYSTLFSLGFANHGAATSVVVADASGTIASIEVPATSFVSVPFGPFGARFNAPLTITPAAALDITAVIK